MMRLHPCKIVKNHGKAEHRVAQVVEDLVKLQLVEQFVVQSFRFIHHCATVDKDANIGDLQSMLLLMLFKL